jgi:hypothetical protein
MAPHVTEKNGNRYLADNEKIQAGARRSTKVKEKIAEAAADARNPVGMMHTSRRTVIRHAVNGSERT